MPAWCDQLICANTGEPLAIARNVKVVLEKDPAVSGAIARDDFTGQTMLVRPVPWEPSLSVPRPWEKVDDMRVAYWLAEQGVSASPGKVRDVVDEVGRGRSYHPLRKYLEASAWDREPRLGDNRNVGWLTRYLGVADNPAVRTVGVAWLLFAVARVFAPGCKGGGVLVLGGAGGLSQSEVLKVLSGDFYLDDIATEDARVAQAQLVGLSR
jgi:predicted P-loop ATPase